MITKPSLASDMRWAPGSWSPPNRSWGYTQSLVESLDYTIYMWQHISLLQMFSDSATHWVGHPFHHADCRKRTGEFVVPATFGNAHNSPRFSPTRADMPPRQLGAGFKGASSQNRAAAAMARCSRWLLTNQKRSRCGPSVKPSYAFDRCV